LKPSNLLAVAALLASSALVSPAQAGPADPVIAAERAFSARAAEVGIGQSFVDNMTDDAIVFGPAPTSAKKLYGGRPSKAPKDGGASLVWWPNWAGIARSGDLGFTTGPAELNGKRSVNYFTVWAKQADGTWKWVYDGGASDATAGLPADAPVAELPVSTAPDVAPTEAMAQVQHAETLLAEKAGLNAREAYKVWLASGARLQGADATKPANTAAANDAELAKRAPQIAFKALGGSASKAGDLVWTYGKAEWQRAGEPGVGYYVRIWQAQKGGYRIVFDQLLEAPPPKKA
jgi:ketosteroid isomerase-like protein